MFTGCVYKILFEPLRRTLHSFLPSILHGRGEQRRTPSLMAAQCLNGLNIYAAFEQERDERVPQRGTQPLALIMLAGLSGMNFRVPDSLLNQTTGDSYTHALEPECSSTVSILKVCAELDLGCHGQLACPCPPPRTGRQSRQWHPLPVCPVLE